jgi:isopenicillin N synthase-like dioxygenase
MAEIADLPHIDFQKLVINDHFEIDRLLLACQTNGFFYLALNDETFLSIWNSALCFMDQYFDQDLENKMFDWKNSDTWGYVDP